MSLVTTAISNRSRSRLQSASTSAVLPEPTGPATPRRSGCGRGHRQTSASVRRFDHERKSREYCVSCRALAMACTAPPTPTSSSARPARAPRPPGSPRPRPPACAARRSVPAGPGGRPRCRLAQAKASRPAPRRAARPTHGPEREHRGVGHAARSPRARPRRSPGRRASAPGCAEVALLGASSRVGPAGAPARRSRLDGRDVAGAPAAMRRASTGRSSVAQLPSSRPAARPPPRPRR